VAKKRYEGPSKRDVGISKEGVDMKLLFLRGQVPKDRNPKQIMFDSLEECDDVWTQLAFHTCKQDYGEVWYWGGTRTVRYKENFIERWVPNYGKYTSNFVPDVVFARGGFPQYDVMFNRYPKAFKIYYGAGRRFIPQSNFKKYDLILVDTPKQLAKVKSALPKARAELLLKPAADNIFKPAGPCDKKYDVIFCSNEHKSGIKGHGFVLPVFPKDLNMIQVGISSRRLRARYPHIRFTEWIPREKIPTLYAQSKVAVVCCTAIDSCPRIVPEAIACDCPLLILDTVNLWHDKYITSQTGRVTSQANFLPALREMLEQYPGFSPYNYYKENLTLEIAGRRIQELIG